VPSLDLEINTKPFNILYKIPSGVLFDAQGALNILSQILDVYWFEKNTRDRPTRSSLVE
jgi:hypothetical protein